MLVLGVDGARPNGTAPLSEVSLTVSFDASTDRKIILTKPP